jgi:hypothetical protein
MTSEPVRDPRGDHLLTPQNCALIIIDYQPTGWVRGDTAEDFQQILFGGERALAGVS